MKIKLFGFFVLCFGLFCTMSLAKGLNDSDKQEPDSQVELGAEVRDGTEEDGFIIC